MKTKEQKKSMVGEIKLSYKKKKNLSSDKIRYSQDMVAFIRKVFPDNLINHREYAYAIYLNRCNRILGYFQISSGGLSATIIDPKIVFQAALLANANAIILFHNHPSGFLDPSCHDINITEKIRAAGKMLDIQLLDHIILTDTGYYSFADNGMIDH